MNHPRIWREAKPLHVSILVVLILLLVPACKTSNKKDLSANKSEIRGSHYTAKAIGVESGNTFYIYSGGRKYRVRLYGAYHPDEGQPLHEDSRKFLADLILKKTVQIVFVSFIRFGGENAIVYCDGRCINEEMIRNGYALFSDRFGKNPGWEKSRDSARSQKLGVWQYEKVSFPEDYLHDRKRAEKKKS